MARAAAMGPKSVDEREIILPFLKWAGGKRWLVQAHPDLFDIPFERYIEPFLGSAAVYFHLQPRRSLLSDSNARLIACYEAVRGRPTAVVRYLRGYHRAHTERLYYEERARTYANGSARAAAQFIYLNRVCWNGLYRVNLRGEFNVPIGTKSNVWLKSDNFEAISARLSQAKLIAGDFEAAIRAAREGDFVFADPPYTVQHNLNGFVKYNEQLFQWSDQERLAAVLKAAKRRGVQFIVSNADHKSVIDLYRSFARVESVKRPSVIGGTNAKRGLTTELIISS